MRIVFCVCVADVRLRPTRGVTKMRKLGDKQRLSSDTKILIALMKSQPLTRDELIEESKISKSQFYRTIPLLKKHHCVEKIEGKYVINVGGYKDGLVELDNLFQTLKKKEYPFKIMSLADLAFHVQKPVEDIKEAAYILAKKYGYKIGQKTDPSIKPYLYGQRLELIYGSEDIEGDGIDGIGDL